MPRVLPYEMFDIQHSANAARRFDKLENIYHRGQKLAWDGEAVLEELWQRHGGTELAAHQRDAAQRLLGNIMWGELAAWKIAAQLADRLEPLEARMAATSQAHDEARHFYVMHDYLVRACGDFPRKMTRYSEKLVAATLNADTVPKKIIGMQLQLETTALTIFHALREAKVCPVLTELLVYYEKDEARHVGLGTQLLPTLMRTMSIPERVEFSLFSFKIAGYSLASLKESEQSLRILGIDPRRVAVLGKSKQMMVFDELWQLAPDAKSDVGERVGRLFDGVAETLWPQNAGAQDLRSRLRGIRRALSVGYEQVETVLDPSQPASESVTAVQPH